jgi:two-component sensor histidine kinase
MGFDVLHERRRWLEDDVTMLQVVGEMITNAYLREQAHEQMALSLREKEALLREVHHRVKNNLQVISSLLSLGAQSHEQGDPGDLLQSIHARVQAIALLHETLYRSGDMAKVDAAAYIQDLASMVFRFEQTHPGAVGLDFDTQHVSINPDTAVPLGLIVTELVTNGLKHAFPDLHERAQKPEIHIALRPRDDGKYDLRVADNGIGLPKGFDRRRATGMGLQLVYMLADQLNGTVRAGAAPGGGSLFRITFDQIRYRERSLPHA